MTIVRDIAWFLAELVLFIILVPVWVPLLLLSLGYSLLCPYAYKPEKE